MEEKSVHSKKLLWRTSEAYLGSMYEFHLDKTTKHEEIMEELQHGTSWSYDLYTTSAPVLMMGEHKTTNNYDNVEFKSYYFKLI